MWKRTVRYGKYELLAKLPSEGLGQVHLATSGSRHVVVKRLSLEESKDPARARAFMDEARIASRISHPSAPRVFEHGHHQGELFMVREHIDAPTLRDTIRKSATRGAYLPLDWVIDVVVSMLDVLAYAHERSVIHGNLLPRRVITSQTGGVQVAGFGATHLPARLDEIPYRAPELLTSDRRTVSTDVYAVGAILFELLTNRSLFHGESTEEAWARVVSTERIPPSMINGKVPPELDAAVLGAIALETTARIGSARKLLAALTSIDVTTMGTTPPPSFKHIPPAFQVPIPMPGVPSHMETDEIIRPPELQVEAEAEPDSPIEDEHDTLGVLEALIFDRPAAPIAAHITDFPIWIRDGHFAERGPLAPPDALTHLAQMTNDQLKRTVVSPDTLRWFRATDWVQLFGAPPMTCPPMPNPSAGIERLDDLLALAPTGILYAADEHGERHAIEVERGELIRPLDPRAWFEVGAQLGTSSLCQMTGIVSALHWTLSRQIGLEAAMATRAHARISKVRDLMLSRSANRIRSWTSGRIVLLDRVARLDNQTVRA